MRMHWQMNKQHMKTYAMAVVFSTLPFTALALEGENSSVVVESSATLTAQTTNASVVENEYLASFDVSATLPVSNGQWSMLIEANTSPKNAGVSAFLPEANADAGTALDGSGKGRIQISELHYDFKTEGGEWAIGLLDGAAYIDTSDVANDETTQFLGSSFVNNPTIALPDYSLGLSYHHPTSDNKFGYSVLVMASHGLADTDGTSYSDLFKLGGEGKGAFVAMETYWNFATVTARLGAWRSSADSPILINQREDDHNYGFYTILDGHHSAFSWNIRAGIASLENSNSESFISIATEIPFAENALGVAVGHTMLDKTIKATGHGNTSHFELYFRYTGFRGIEITPSIQYLKNSEFDRDEFAGTDDIIVAGIRFGLGF